MAFFSPWNLAWLGLLFPVIIFFYLLKLKRREVVVSSVLLWSHLVKDMQANAPFQKLRKNLLLFLQLLIAALAVFALARPAAVVSSLGGSHVVVILDGSASMQSRDAGGTRFDAARATAERMIGRMRGGDRMMLLLATSHTQRLTPFTRDRNLLRRALRDARPADTTTHLRDALLLAASLSGAGARESSPETVGMALSGHRIFVLSDGAFPPLEDVDLRGSEVQFVKLGQRSENVGIVALDVRRAFRETADYQMFVAVRNYSPSAKKTNIEFYRNEVLIDVRPLELPAADKTLGYSEKAEVFGNLKEASGILQAKLDLQDDLEVDNIAYSQLSVRQDLRVLLVTDGDLYLERALNLDPHVKVSTISPSGYTGQSGFDVVVFENVGPKAPPAGNHLYINCAGPTAPVTIRRKITEASILDWDRVHPAMRYVKLSQLRLPEALSAELKPWGTQLAEHESGVAVAVGEHEGFKSAYVGFPLLRTEFPLRVAFPIFFNNMAQWLAARPGRTEGLQLRTGQTASLEVRPGISEITVTSPSGQKQIVRPDGRIAYAAGTEERGIYTAEGRNYRAQFAVNLLSRDESATQPQDRIQFGNRPVLAGTGSARTHQELWRWLLLLGLAVLGIEWWVYHRRI